MSYLQVIDSLAPLVGEKWGWFWVCRFDPWREKLPFVSLVPEVLVQVSVGDLLQRLHVVHRNEVGVEIHELDASLLERTLRQKMTLDPEANRKLIQTVSNNLVFSTVQNVSNRINSTFSRESIIGSVDFESQPS